MEKKYRLLDWLSSAQAVDWLQDLTGIPVTSTELLQLCETQQCPVYADVCGLTANEYGFDNGIAKGIHLVTNPLEAFGSGCSPRDPREIWTKGDTLTQVGAALLFDAIPSWKRAPIFKPANIRALADNMNRVTEQPSAAEVEDLRQQLEQERLARHKAVAENLHKTDDKPLDKRERATFERLVYVLADQAKYTFQQLYSDEEAIQLHAKTIGVKGLTGKGSIAKKLKAAAARFAQDKLDHDE